MTKRITWMLLLLVLSACAAPQTPDKSAAALDAMVAKAALDDLRNAAAALPGATVSAGDPLTIGYPGQALFSEGAALPLAGGTEMLDPLAALLAGDGPGRWQGTVRAASGVSAEYDLLLAEKRAELLVRYFASRGIGSDRLSLQALAGSGPAFELVRQN